MQLTVLASLLASVAMTASAAPSTGIEARQGVPRVRATFYRDQECGRDGRPYADDFVPLQNTTATGLSTCMNFPPSFNYPSTFFNETMLTRTLRFYDLPCEQLADVGSGHHIDIAPGFTAGCLNLTLKSYVTL
ncbi:uncharacterized protein J4E88_004711 [Alternaria novae-zelandiae]|uniref:uncharacterized protein n=1 Tax=Alternaria triticimaculans TaxID=297637 RepID=UPI0020C36C49|nr:uncharacterized protein J4E78_000707 [Alternaria triticimaculans]XP_049255916.1 uncharacterized protein J4E88_004711 [Alternaria novae-zelandiae]KAI4672207.1 hypothetical protein J4E78_000707 [Alternaria triticimaculans]KAI4683535.1 hypothetical protein J4E88_004711 [Alternaria novae-zelandiae]